MKRIQPGPSFLNRGQQQIVYKQTYTNKYFLLALNFYHFPILFILLFFKPPVYNQKYNRSTEVITSSLPMFAAYTRLLQKFPVLTKMFTSGVLFSFGDAITQIVIDKKPKFDFGRNLNLFFVGTTYVGPLLHVWYCKMLPAFGNTVFKESTKKSTRVLALMSADQLIFTPLYLVGFFIYNSLINNFSLKGLKKGIQNCKDKIWQTLIINWMIWPIAMTINFWYMPVLYQVPFVMCLEFFWNIILSYIAYDEGPENRIISQHSNKAKLV